MVSVRSPDFPAQGEFVRVWLVIFGIVLQAGLISSAERNELM